jgi:hypothetical protein
MMNRPVFALLLLISSLTTSGAALAQPAPAPAPMAPSGAPATPYGAPATPYGAPATPYGAPATPYGAPATPYGAPAYGTPLPPPPPGMAGMPAMGTEAMMTDEEKAKAKEPKAGDFDAGGQMRLPSGPDATGKFATFNWVAVDLKGTYYLLKWLTVTGAAPLAVKKPEMLMTGEDPRMLGGLTARLEAKLPSLDRVPGIRKGTEIGLLVSAGYLREGAFLLSEKDYPAFYGDFKPGLTTGLTIKLKMSSVVDLSTTPVFVYQAASQGSLMAVQLPVSLILGLGSLVKVSADLGVFTGDNYSFGGDNGGRIAAGGALTVKLGPILAHAGAGAASLLTGGLYPTISDSIYIDLNVKYVK